VQSLFSVSPEMHPGSSISSLPLISSSVFEHIIQLGEFDTVRNHAAVTYAAYCQR